MESETRKHILLADGNFSDLLTLKTIKKDNLSIFGCKSYMMDQIWPDRERKYIFEMIYVGV